MMLLTAITCLLLCAWGHLFRDGWPPTGSDFEARSVGALLCAIGALPAIVGGHHSLWYVPAVFGAILVGFMIDQLHAAGQGCDKPIDILYLAISGITSLVPLAGVGYLLHGPYGLLVFVGGLLKPAIWYGSWDEWNESAVWSFAAPTRVAATLFGLDVGVILLVLFTT